MNKFLSECISIDVEATGLDPEKNSIISIGACLFNSDEQLYVENFLRPNVEILDQALKVNGATREGLLSRDRINYVSEVEALERLAEFATRHGAYVIVGKNPEFDYNFLRAIYERAGKETAFGFPFSYRKINWANMVIPLMLREEIPINHENLSSDAISRFLELPEEEKPHNALTGARHNVLCVEKILKAYEQLDRKSVIKEKFEIS